MTVYQRVVIIAAVCLCMGGIMMLLDVPFMTRGMKQKYTDESVKSYHLAFPIPIYIHFLKNVLFRLVCIAQSLLIFDIILSLYLHYPQDCVSEKSAP